MPLKRLVTRNIVEHAVKEPLGCSTDCHCGKIKQQKSTIVTIFVFNQIKLGPNAITHSAHTLYNTAVTGRGSSGGNRNVAQSVAAPNASDLRVAGLEGGEAGDATINLTALNETDCNLLPPHSCNQEMPSAPSPLVMNKGQSVIIKYAELS